MLRRTLGLGSGALGAALATQYVTGEKAEHGSALQQLLIFDALRVVGWVARKRHDRQCEAFEEAQRALLREQLERNAGTDYGREHNFAGILASDDVVAAFREQHPLVQYNHYQPWIEKIANGETNVLNSDPETMLAATSGTSGQRALLPYNRTMASRFFASGILVVFDTLRRLAPDALGMQKSCKLAFAPSWTYAPCGLRIGPNSSNPLDKSFRRLLLLYSTPAAGYAISDSETAALYVHALVCRAPHCIAPLPRPHEGSLHMR